MGVDDYGQVVWEREMDCWEWGLRRCLATAWDTLAVIGSLVFLGGEGWREGA